MNITKEDKARICARAFFQDNQDQYEDYHEALTEFTSGNNVSDSFIDFAVEHYLTPVPGYILVTNAVGHVVNIRDSDGFLEPVTEMSEEECEAMNEAFHEAADKYADLTELALLEKIGWKVLTEAKN